MEESTFRPWYPFYGDARPNLDYFRGSIYEYFKLAAEKFAAYYAYEFQGKKTTYSQFLYDVDCVALALDKLGITRGDKVTIAMPNCPQGITFLYALNKIGAVANMIHPLSAQEEIAFYINFSMSKAIITLDQFYPKVKSIKDNCPTLKYIFIGTVKEELPSYMRIPYQLTIGKKINKVNKNEDKVIFYKNLKRIGQKLEEKQFVPGGKDDVAAILYSGGTTGTPKGIMLTNYNFNVVSDQIIETNQMFRPGDLFLSIMPIFHGFGLGVAIHTMLTKGGCCILVPRFTPKSVCKLINKYHPQLMAGVPTLYAAMLDEPSFQKSDLSSFKGIFSGGDSLSIELKRKIDSFLKEHNCKVRVREGYGMTESMTASCLTPIDLEKEGSIGIPLPDMVFCICEPGTDKVLPAYSKGEICISGPSIMKGYLNNKEETDEILKLHRDGLLYLHSGDLGYQDADGFVYYVQRLKRMIVTNGYNIYPSQLENIIDSFEKVQMSCVIGVKDPIRMEKIKAFIVLKDGVLENEETKEEIREYLRTRVAKYSLPHEIEFRKEFPKTLVGKIAYRVLEEEEEKKNNI